MKKSDRAHVARKLGYRSVDLSKPVQASQSKRVGGKRKRVRIEFVDPDTYLSGLWDQLIDSIRAYRFYKKFTGALAPFLWRKIMTRAEAQYRENRLLIVASCYIVTIIAGLILALQNL